MEAGQQTALLPALPIVRPREPPIVHLPEHPIVRLPEHPINSQVGHLIGLPIQEFLRPIALLLPPQIVLHLTILLLPVHPHLTILQEVEAEV